MILAIDTATRWTGIALHDGLNVVAEMGWLSDGAQKRELAEAVHDLLRKTSVVPADLKGIVVATGPGAYACLREGLAFAKGIALAYNTPLVGVSTLDVVMAACEQRAGQLVVVAETGRDHVSAATYRWYSRKGWQVKREPELYSWKTLLKKTKADSGFTGEISAESRKLIRSADKGFHVLKGVANARRAGYLAELGQTSLRKNNLLDPTNAIPTYLQDPIIEYTKDDAGNETPALMGELTLDGMPPSTRDGMILAIDTATRWTGIALYDGETLLAETGWHARNTQTMELAPTVAKLLRQAGVSVENLAGIAVAIGPGSYTGLRIGLGFAKGLSLVHGVPIVGISTLDILVAAIGESDEQLVVVTEAGRTRVSAATYRWYSRKGWQIKQETANYKWPELLAQVKEGTHFVGEVSAEARKLIRSADQGFRVLKGAQSVRRASYLAELGRTALQKEPNVDAAVLTPAYVQAPAGA